MHCPLFNGHCAWSILPVGGANGILLGAASWQQAGYTRVGHLGRLARGRPTDTAGPSLAWAPVPGGGPGGAPRCRALGQEQTTGGSKITIVSVGRHTPKAPGGLATQWGARLCYTARGTLAGFEARGWPTDTAGPSPARAPVPGGSPGGAPRCRALWEEQPTGGSKHNWLVRVAEPDNAAEQRNAAVQRSGSGTRYR